MRGFDCFPIDFIHSKEFGELHSNCRLKTVDCVVVTRYARKKKVAQDIIRILVRRRERGFMTDLPPIILHAESISDK